MGKYWFTSNDGEFDPDDPQLTPLFRDQVVSIREVFGMNAGDPGTEMGSGGWVRYHSEKYPNTHYEVQVLMFQWNKWETRKYADVYIHSPGSEGNARQSFTPVFRMNLRVRKFVPAHGFTIDMSSPGFVKRWTIKLLKLIGAVQELEPIPIGNEYPKGMAPEIFFDKWIEIIFDRDFPTRTPSVFLPDDKIYDVDSGEKHHLYKNHQMCILAHPSDWSGNDTVTRAVFAAVAWIIWHQNEFGKC